MRTVYVRLALRFVNIRFTSASYIGCVRQKNEDGEFCKEDTPVKPFRLRGGCTLEKCRTAVCPETNVTSIVNFELL